MWHCHRDIPRWRQQAQGGHPCVWRDPCRRSLTEHRSSQRRRMGRRSRGIRLDSWHKPYNI